jgi:maleylacetate reductase
MTTLEHELAGAQLRAFARTALPGRVVFGQGALRDIGREADLLGAQRILLVVAAYDAGLVEAAVSALGDRVVRHWDEVRQHVPRDLAARATQAARDDAADAILTVGGGSTTGLGKAIAVQTALPLIAVGTTYAGSEMTPIYGLTSEGEKRTAQDLRALPKVAIYDPNLVLTLPPAVVGPSGMNALAHCVEALWAPDGDPITDLLALEGARLLHDHLAAAYDDAAPGPRGHVQLAACLAGSALGTAGTSIHHALCHLLGGMFDLPHAETHAVVLPYAVDFATQGLPDARQRLGRVLRCQPDEIAGRIWDLGARVGTPHGLRAIGLQRHEAEQAAQLAVDRGLKSPRPLDGPTARQLLLDAWNGDRPSHP